MKKVLLAVIAIGLGGASLTIASEASAYSGWYWQQVSGCATSIAVDGHGGNPFITGCTTEGAGGYDIYQYNGSAFTQFSTGQAVDIADTNSDFPWIVSKTGYIYSWNGSSWASEPGCGTSIGAGSGVYITGCTTESSGGFGIYDWTGSAWNEVGGQATQVSVGSDGTVWIINAHNQIYYWNGSGWTNVPGCATSIAANWGGQPWIVGCTSTGPNGNGVYYYSGGQWNEVESSNFNDCEFTNAQAVKISVGGGIPWTIDNTGAIYQWRFGPC